MRRFLAELKRRHVYKVGAAYLVAAFVVLQLADLAVGALPLPTWLEPTVWVLSGLGFPLALVLAWAFDLTPEGVERTSSADASGRERAAGSTSNSLERSLAVLPFQSLGKKEAGPLTEGMHDALLTRLSNVSGLTVISRQSVQQYRVSEKTSADIARELGVNWVVEGGVVEMGQGIQVTARLIDPRTDAHAWADSYRRDLTAENLFAVQTEITKEIASSLEARLTPAEQERVERKPTDDLEAYRLYVRGRQQLAGRTFGFQVGWRVFEEEGSRSPGGPIPELAGSEHVQRAVEYFHQAIEKDESFALAWAGLADAAAWYPSGVPDSAPAATVSQEAAARRALEFGPDLAESHASMGFMHLAKCDAPAAVQQLTQALELKPSYWEAHHWLGELYLKIGRAEKALDHLTLAVELNPRHALARHWLYDAYLAAGESEKSLREARRQRSLGLERVNAVAGEIRALYHLGQFPEAERLAREQLSELQGQISETHKGLWPVAMSGHLAAALAAQGDMAGAREQLDWLRSEEAELFWIGFVHASIGETDQALDAWERMDADTWGRIPALHHLRYGVILDLAPLRDNVRFSELIRDANRYWGLNPDGSLPDS